MQLRVRSIAYLADGINGYELVDPKGRDKVARLKMFPVAVQVPWGISPALLPEVPLPTKIRTAFQEPIELADDPERTEDEDYVRDRYEAVQASIQAGVDALARRRRLPLFG